MNKATLETEEELQLIKEYTLLPILLDVLERDVAVLEKARLKMSPVYVRKLKQAQDQISIHLAHIRKALRRRGIKVYELQRTRLGIEAHYLCKGYNHTFSMLWSLVKAELYKELSSLLERKQG
ncbi:Uncharacterised protein [Chlamydia abortus]|uniref:hypothetical protein n=1 Tax=Paenibacillus sp. 32O-W TaxID=1695218 RepID=UPI000A27E0F3|nr:MULTISPECIES: hypothetical protein [Paenibacillaceae]SHE11651.1 Uncharacterised protein [Chlamydia abortus]